MHTKYKHLVSYLVLILLLKYVKWELWKQRTLYSIHFWLILKYTLSWLH